MTSFDNLCEVVITAPDADWLGEFAKEPVQDRLCASAHVLPMRTIYRWQGQVHDKPEARVALHTRVTQVSRIVERTLQAHPYDVPAVVALPMAGGSPAYLEWVINETED